MSKIGAYYIAWGEKHVEVARRSARSFKKANPHMETAIACNKEDDATGFDRKIVIPAEAFTDIPSMQAKVTMLAQSPFERTLYLDNDTLIRTDLTSMFALLDSFEMCGAHVALWDRPTHQRKWKTTVPECFPQINCGVLLYRKCEQTDKFLADWNKNFRQAYAENKVTSDQITFRELLWTAPIRFMVLPPQFNKRMHEASELIYSDQPKPRILHLLILRPQKSRFMQWISNFVR